MRTPVRKRLQFLLTAIVVFTAGFQLLPEQLAFSSTLTIENLVAMSPLLLAVFGYFIFLPVLYWFWVIKAGQQKPWKMFLIFSLSALCARYSFPSNIAEYFEFITYLRYPIIGVLLIIELYLMVTIVKGLWRARKLSGDPRVHAFNQYQDDDKKLTLAVPFAWEPASWYYAIPKFSRNHAKALAQLQVNSTQRWHWLLLLTGCVVLGTSCYWLLAGWSELVAIIVASFFFYSVIFSTANHRIARHYSVYLLGDKLVVNAAFWSFIAIDTKAIAEVNLGDFQQTGNKEQLLLGKAKAKGSDKSKAANIELVFSEPQTYMAMMGQMPEPVNKLWLAVDKPEQLKQQLSEALVAPIHLATAS
ncbi:hypothetical protein [Thalassotalea euphylliae]|uniref:Uncharacterized protein n=1 Tax=Thalassotalea euphylliae TaxID=1655234 RepID=A0A3E0UB37_9GAMM|nr:hypothetical protein [Thalassotalea euphylliae]REL34211.1 hypothetical protein DXX92_01980 [Thalassotalea euphylliae]